MLEIKKFKIELYREQATYSRAFTGSFAAYRITILKPKAGVYDDKWSQRNYERFVVEACSNNRRELFGNSRRSNKDRGEVSFYFFITLKL
jgi:hypothetical protein